MREIRVYVEGGGDQKAIWSKLRESLGTFLQELSQIARRKHIGWKIIPCGSRQATYNDFCIAVRQNPDILNVLLVDAENSPVVNTGQRFFHKMPWAHLKDRDGWNCPSGVYNTQCFLMVECMEAWLVADQSNLRAFYGSCLAVRALPGNPNVEAIPKQDIYKALARATSRCDLPYHKTRHAFDILRSTNPKIVRDRAPHCKRLFDVLAAQMGADLP